jgi:hypothetical protein
MKIYYPIGNIILLISAIFFTNARSAFAADQGTGGVTVKEDAIVMHSGTKLSKDDEKALNDVLKKYDKKLYRVDEIKNGKLTKSIGELKIDAQMESELAKARAMGNSDFDVVFSPGPYARVPENRTFTQKEDAKKLIQELKPILEKYSKK